MLISACTTTSGEAVDGQAPTLASAAAAAAPGLTPPPTATLDPHPAPSGAPTSWDGDGQVRDHPPLPEDPGHTAATEVAVSAMRAFARPDLDDDTWWRDFRAFLTTQAVLDYSNTDPAEVPATTITGPARVIASPGDTLARIQVPTDAGLYLVILTRSREVPQWRVDRLLPPEIRVGD